MKNDIPVLIVGAGPTGLMMATVLHRYDVPFRIIDKKRERTATSNALGLHARTLELLEDLNLIDDFLHEGKRISAATLYANQRPFADIHINTINSEYPYILITPQSITEKILEEHLQRKGIFVERNTTLTQIKKIEHCYDLTVEKNGELEHITAQYVIAADGAHSTVREQSGIHFMGHDIPQQFMLADATIKTHLPMNKLHAFYAKDGILAVFPLPNGEVRLIGDIPKTEKSEAQSIIKNIFEMRSHQTILIERCSWVSTFWIHSKYIENMQHENIFFMGDAAHIHSPAGGQGMNTGMQDAYNLGWKLALVLQGKATEHLLGSFHQERHPVIRAVVNQTDTLTRLLLAQNPITLFFRNVIMRPLLRLKKINKKIATHLAMLDVCYPKSSIIHYASSISNRSPQPGTLVPEIKTFHPKQFKSYLNHKKHELLVFCGDQPHEATLNHIKKLCDAIKFDYEELIDIFLICDTPLKMPIMQLYDSEKKIHRAFNVDRPALVLIRPDKYIAYCSASLEEKTLKKYLQQHFILKAFQN